MGRNALLDCGYLYCASAWWLLDEIHFISTWTWTRIQRLRFSISLQNGEVCSADASGCSSCSELVALGKPDITSMSFHVAETRDDGQHVSPYFYCIFGLLFGVEALRFRVCISMTCSHTHSISEHASETETTTTTIQSGETRL